MFNPVVETVREFIIANKLICEGDSVISAVSGGADSVAMTLILSKLCESMGFELSLAHLNHKLRGQSSDDDAQYCVALAENLSCRIYCEEKDINAERSKDGGSVEKVARDVRYEFYKRAVNNLNANKLAIAHHQDDQCETIIFNLIRGSSFHGLRGIPLKRDLDSESKVQIIRPLLCLRKNEIEDYLRSEDIFWQEDHTNSEIHASRNLIRHKILPVFKELNPSFEQHLLELGRQGGETEEIIDREAERIFSAAVSSTRSIRIERWRLNSLQDVVSCEVIRRMIIEIGGGLQRFTSEHFKKIVHLKRKIDLPDKLTAHISAGCIVIEAKAREPRMNTNRH